jgi:hypothetical protein
MDFVIYNIYLHLFLISDDGPGDSGKLLTRSTVQRCQNRSGKKTGIEEEDSDPALKPTYMTLSTFFFQNLGLFICQVGIVISIPKPVQMVRLNFIF